MDHTPLTSDKGHVALSAADLLPDAHGEVVLLNEAGVLAFNLTGSAPAIASGVADSHTTAIGIDVTGMAYSTFEGGLTLYYPTEVTLVIG